MRELLNTNHTEIMEQLPKLVTENIIQNIRIDGVQQMSKNDLECMLNNFMHKYNNNQSQQASSTQELLPENTHNLIDDHGYHFWTWGGLMRPVPPNWRFPRGQIKAVCDLFISGTKSPNIRPFRLINCSQLSKEDRAYFSKAETVFETVCETAVMWDDCHVRSRKEFRTMSLVEWDGVFNMCFSEIVRQLFVEHNIRMSKPGAMSIVTFYDKLPRTDRFRRSDIVKYNLDKN